MSGTKRSGIRNDSKASGGGPISSKNDSSYTKTVKRNRHALESIESAWVTMP